MNKTIVIAAFVFSIIGAASVGYSAGIFVRPPADTLAVEHDPSTGTPTSETTATSSTPDVAVAPTTRTAPTVSPSSAASTNTTPAKPTTPPATTAPAQKTGITVADVAEHGTASNCWVIISGKVYDMTSYISQHPGGRKAITRECGGDGTAVFDDERAHSRPGTMEELAQFYLGDVTN